MPIAPQEDPPIQPGKPSEPPQESPPGNPRPEVPPPMQDPGEPPRPEELPGHVPDELPVRGPPATPGPPPATVGGILASQAAPGFPARASGMPQGALKNFNLKRWSECAMNDDASRLSMVRKKFAPDFESRHNPA